MSSWIPRTTNANMIPSNRYFWDDSLNVGATFYVWYPYYGASGAVYCNTYNLALPNCTTYAYGRILEAGDPAPISGFHNASAWHSNLANGWTAIPYNINNVKAGDILEWVGSNHVAVVEKVENGTVYVSESAYTDDNGGVYGDRTDTVWGSTKQSVYNYGTINYPNRFFHYGTFYFGSGNPTYILKNPNPHTPDTNTFRFFSRKPKRMRRLRYV